MADVINLNIVIIQLEPLACVSLSGQIQLI